MSKREQILKTCIRKMKRVDYENITDLNVDDTFEVERFVFSGKNAYIQVNLLDEILCVIIPEDELALLLYCSDYIDDYNITSFDVWYRDWNYTADDYTLRTATLEDYFNGLNTDVVKKILFEYADEYCNYN